MDILIVCLYFFWSDLFSFDILRGSFIYFNSDLMYVESEKSTIVSKTQHRETFSMRGKFYSEHSYMMDTTLIFCLHLAFVVRAVFPQNSLPTE